MSRKLRIGLGAALTVPLFAATIAVAEAGTPAPDQISPSTFTVQVDLVAGDPGAIGPGVVPGTFGPNLGSPVPIKNKLYLVDQNDGISRINGVDNVQQIWDVSDAPDGLFLDNRQSVLNISPGPAANSIYVMFQAGNAGSSGVDLHPMPAPLPGICCNPGAPVPVADLYRIGAIPPPVNFFGVTRTEYQVLYEYKLTGDELQDPRAIVAFETQSGPTHNGGGMVTLPDGRVVFATGDALPFGAEGRAAPQDPDEIVSKLIIIDPDDGSIEIAAMGIRNVQHMQLADIDGELTLAFGDIGGVTAEEVNYVSVADLVDTATIENFGWGRNLDGLAREGTFHVSPGLPLAFAEPAVTASASSPEPGFIQPNAQYGRNDPNGGVAVSGPAVSDESLTSLTAVFSDLASGLLYGTTAPISDIDATVFLVNLVDGDGASLGSFQDLAGGRADPRLFTFPDGTAGVLLETTGDIYRLTQVS